MLTDPNLPVFPVDVPTNSFATIIDILRSGDIMDRRAEFAWHEWLVQGWLARLLFGHPDSPTVMGERQMASLSRIDVLVLLDLADALEAATGETVDPAMRLKGSGPITSIVIARIVKELVAMLEKFIEKYLDKLGE